MGLLEDFSGPTGLLRQPLDSINELRPIPWLERLTLRRNFRGEQIHFGPPQRWLDRSWDLRVGSVGGTIYKVALEAKAATRDDAVEISTDVYSAPQGRLGAPSQQAEGIFLWDAADGNAILQVANVGRDRRIFVFFTSSIARTFVRRK